MQFFFYLYAILLYFPYKRESITQELMEIWSRPFLKYLKFHSIRHTFIEIGYIARFSEVAHVHFYFTYDN